MKTRNKSIFYDIHWKLLYVLPIVAYLLFVVSRHGTSVQTFSTYLIEWIPDFANDFLYKTFESVFSSTGIFPLAAYDVAISFAAYYFSVFSIHICVDIVLFLPKMCMHLLDKWGY